MAMVISTSRRLHWYWSSLLVIDILSFSVNAFNSVPIFASCSRHGGSVVYAVPPPASTTTTLIDDDVHNVGGASILEPTALVTLTLRHTQPVYIEDTDAYGLMYNGNYLRAYDRALHTANSTANAAHAAHSSSSGMDDQWSIVAVQRQKFKSSPALGEIFAVTATLRATPPGGSEIWDMDMQAAATSFDNDHNDDDNDQVEKDSVTVYNTAAGVTIARPPNQQQQQEQEQDNKANNDNNNAGNRPRTPAWLPEPAPMETTSRAGSDKNGKETVSTFTVFRDEFDAHLDGHLPLRSVLNLFERARSDCLGGPDKLRRLQEQDSILFVVVAIDDLSLVHWNPATTTTSTAKATNDAVVVTPNQQVQRLMLSAGQQVQVTTDYVVKRSGMILECRQTAWVQGSRMAQGVVTLMALNAQTRRPTSKLPVWLQELLL